jgi:hypothetical protein
MEAAMSKVYDPLGDAAPELARTLVASVQQRITCGAPASRRSGASAQAVPVRARRPCSRVPAVPACRAFPGISTPRSRPLGGINWSIAPTWCAMAPVWLRTATCAALSSRRHPNKAWTRRQTPSRRARVGHSC